MTTTIHGPFAIVRGTGTIFRHVPSRREVYFQPGDDQDYFRGEIERAELAHPTRETARILADLWQEFEYIAQPMPETKP